MHYAQLDASGKCIGVSMLSGEVSAPHMIEITGEQYAGGGLLGREYLGNGEWGDMPEPPVPPGPDPGLESRVGAIEEALAIIVGVKDDEL